MITAVSLFSSAGIGDLALRDLKVEVLVANELLNDRAELFRTNFPSCEMISGDIRLLKSAIISATIRKLAGRPLDILFATPPCQGMSKNGRGKLLSLVRMGKRAKLDERNQLILDVIDIVLYLRPRVIVLENVPEMRNTLIEVDGNLLNVLDVLNDRLSGDYKGNAEVVEFADYGVPQRRKRLITVFVRSDVVANTHPAKQRSWLPKPTHSQYGGLLEKPWVSVLDALSDIEPLDAAQSINSKSISIRFHRVPLLDKDKYFWVSNTPPNKGAFDNQCVNGSCMFSENPTHGATSVNGINRSNKETPVRCLQCGELLPRPWVVSDGKHRLMSGFTSAYKRMRGDLPASALTRNLSYACSDQKIHPTQHRVLSLHEAIILHTINEFLYEWKRADGKKVSDKLVREVIGESIPPLGLRLIFQHIFDSVKFDADSRATQCAV